MLYSGITKKGLKSIYPEIPCSSCREVGTVRLQVQGGYVHTMFIPLFSSGKIAVSKCNKCDQFLTYNEMSRDFKVAADELKKKTRIPFYYFSGLIIVAIVIPILFVQGYYSSKESVLAKYELFENPEAGDVYFNKIGEEQYTLMLVDSVSVDSLYVRDNKHIVLEHKATSVINEPKKFHLESHGISRNKIRELVANNSLYGAERNNLDK